MAETVVHVLEAVEVEEQHRDEVAGPAPAAALLEALGEAAAVGQLGERVVRGLVREPVLERLEVTVHLRVAQGCAGLGREQLEALGVGVGGAPVAGQRAVRTTSASSTVVIGSANSVENWVGARGA